MEIKPADNPINTPNPEKIGQILGELVKLFQDKSCNPAEMAITCLYGLQAMHQFAAEHKADYPKRMTITTTTGHDISFEVRKVGARIDQLPLAMPKQFRGES